MPQSPDRWRSTPPTPWPHWSLPLLVLSTGFILVGTLSPFDFTPMDWTLGNMVREFFRHPSDWEDLYGNVLLFFPYGLGIAAWLRARSRRSMLEIILWATLASTLLSLMVEICQLFLPTRASSIIDITTNTIGGFLGSTIYLLAQQWHQPESALVLTLKSVWKSGRSVSLALVVWIVLMNLVPLSLAETTNLSNWSLDYPLLLGNEATGDRPWQGSLSALTLSDRALSEEEVTHVLAQPGFPQLPQPLVDYQLTGTAPYRDRLGRGADLNWQAADPTHTAEPQSSSGQTTDPMGGISLGEGRWLSTQKPADRLTQALRRSNQMTLAFVARTQDLKQEGAGRVVSLSADTLHRNFTVSQEADQLSFRIRTPVTGENGSAIMLSVTGIWVDDQPHRFVVTYADGMIVLYVDRADQHYNLHLTPELSLSRYLLPSESHSLRLTPKAIGVYIGLYYGLFCVPLGVLLGRLWQLLRGQPRFYLLLLGLGLVLPTWVFATLSNPGRGILNRRAMLGLAIAAVSMLLPWIGRRWFQSSGSASGGLLK